MRILILTPTALPSITGNAITTERWRRSLRHRGVTAEVFATQDTEVPDLLRELQSFKPDLIHVHHAFRTGSLLLDPRVKALSAVSPLVVSPGGTDINNDIEVRDRKEVVSQVHQMAHVIIAQSRETARQLGTLFPGLKERIALVPKAFSWLGHDAFDLRTTIGCQPEDILFLLPAGIRPVKGNLECLVAFEKVHAVRPRAKIIFAGPDLQAEYTARFRRELERLHSFAFWIPPIPPEAMHSAYESSDIVLNTSFSEGLSNSLLEAIAVGKPVLASNIPGNWWPLLGENGEKPAGLFFETNDPEDFIRHAVRLVDDENLRKALGRAGQELASRLPTPEMEADGLIQTYRKAMSN